MLTWKYSKKFTIPMLLSQIVQNTLNTISVLGKFLVDYSPVIN